MPTIEENIKICIWHSEPNNGPKEGYSYDTECKNYWVDLESYRNLGMVYCPMCAGIIVPAPIIPPPSEAQEELPETQRGNSWVEILKLFGISLSTGIILGYLVQLFFARK